MPRKESKEESAYEIAYSKYESHLNTIYFLLDLYEKKKKRFSKLLKQMEKKSKKNDDMEENATRSKVTYSTRNDLHSANRRQVDSKSKSRQSSSEEDADMLDELKDLFQDLLPPATDTKHNIEKNVSELALSIINARLEKESHSVENNKEFEPEMANFF